MNLVLASTLLLGTRLSGHNYVPPKGYVPNADVAVALARVIATPVYGKKTLADEEPLRATLKNDVWTIKGTLSHGLGGVLLIQISRRTGAILRMTHGK